MLSQPKSFTRRDFQPLQDAYDDLLNTIRTSTPVRSLPQSPMPIDDEGPNDSDRGSSRQCLRRVTIETAPPRTYSYDHMSSEETVGYWNEYDHGSENGDGETEERYVIYADPDATGSPDFKAMLHAFAKPFTKARSWVQGRKPADNEPLLSRQSSGSTYGTTSPPSPGGYFSSLPGRRRSPPSRGNDSVTAVGSDAEDDAAAAAALEAGYSSSEEFPATGYEAHYAALPSLNDQRMDAFRDRVMFMATSGLFAMSFLLLGIATVLIFTGRHRLRVGVDAGATVGAVVSIGCACTALALTMSRWETLGGVNRAVVAMTFCTVCVLNGMLLVLVMGNTAL